MMVLIIEDEAVSRRALQSILRLHGYEARAVGTAEDGLRLIVEGDVPDVAVVDVNLPGMSGVEFVRRVHRTHPKLPCVFMSANDEVNLEQIRNVFREPALRKPFDVSRLIGLIAHAATAATGTPSAVPMGMASGA